MPNMGAQQSSAPQAEPQLKGWFDLDDAGIAELAKIVHAQATAYSNETHHAVELPDKAVPTEKAARAEYVEKLNQLLVYHAYRLAGFRAEARSS